MNILKNKLFFFIYMLLISPFAFSARGPSCDEIGDCSSGSNIFGEIIVVILVFGLIYEGFKESYEKRGLKGPAVILILIGSVAITYLNTDSWGAAPLFTAFAIAFTSVWWLSPIMDRIFPDHIEKNNNE